MRMHGLGERRLAAAGLAGEAEDLAGLVEVHVHVVDRAHEPAVRRCSPRRSCGRKGCGSGMRVHHRGRTGRRLACRGLRRGSHVQARSMLEPGVRDLIEPGIEHASGRTRRAPRRVPVGANVHQALGDAARSRSAPSRGWCPRWSADDVAEPEELQSHLRADGVGTVLPIIWDSEQRASSWGESPA